MSAAQMKIGELAKAANCSTETVRFYEKAGLLPATERTESNYRSYGQAHLERLRFIRNCRALDMTHDEIRGLLNLLEDPKSDCGVANRLIDDHIGHVVERIAELQELALQLKALRQRCQQEQAADACGILHSLATMETEAKPLRHTHVG